MPAVAQCPDGSPPPCRTTARATAGPAAQAGSVAVLYFDNRSRDSNDLYLADGLTEEIITRLSGIQRLTVRSRHLVQRYRGTALSDPASVGRSLGVAYLVTGSIRRAGGRLRLSAELIRADGGAQVWGRQFDQAGDDVFAIQEAVASEVATGIVGELLPSESRSLAARPTSNTAAYEAFLRGNFHLARRDSAGLLRALREYESALRAEPGWTEALARLAITYGIAHGNGLDLGLSLDTVAVRAMRTASEAVRRAPNSSDAWVAVGIARIATQPSTQAGAREALERAIALDPTNAEAHHLLGFNLATANEDSLGLVHDRHALAINPARPVTLMHFVHVAMLNARYHEALRLVDSMLAIDPDFAQGHAARIPLAFLTGDTALGRRLVRERGPAPPVRSLMRAAYGAMVPLHADRDTDTALGMLEAARPRGGLLRYLMRMPAFDPIRSHPRFVSLLRETAP